jgi:hypothetical protein
MLFSKRKELETKYYKWMNTFNTKGILPFDCPHTVISFLDNIGYLKDQTPIEIDNMIEKDEKLPPWYQCPICDFKHIFLFSHYCSNCGVKLEWATIKQTEE